MKEEYLNKLYLHSKNHREEILASKLCGCFCCKKIFKPQDVIVWIKDRDTTALCPFCSIDAVIGDKSGYPINHDVLEKMNKKYFK